MGNSNSLAYLFGDSFYPEVTTNRENYFYDHREGDHFTKYSSSFGSFKEIINFCIENDINNPCFTTLGPDNECLTLSFSLERGVIHYETRSLKYLKIYNVQYIHPTSFYFGLSEHSIIYYPETDQINGELLLHNRNTGVHDQGIFWFVYLLGQFFTDFPKYDNNFSLINQRISLLSEFCYDENYMTHYCLWCGHILETPIVQEQWDDEERRLYCDDCVACLECGTKENLKEFSEGGVLCCECYQHFQNIACLAGGGLGFPMVL